MMAGYGSALTQPTYQGIMRRTAPAAGSRIPVASKQVRDEARHVSAPHRSRLLGMQEAYQQKLMKEKEEKMIAIYNKQQNEALQKLSRHDSNTSNNTGIVRNFFLERKQMERQKDSAKLLSRDAHFQMKLQERKQASDYTSEVDSNHNRNKPSNSRYNSDEQRRQEHEKQREMLNYRDQWHQNQRQQQPKQSPNKDVGRSKPLAPIKRESERRKPHGPPSPGQDRRTTSQNYYGEENSGTKPFSKPQKVSRQASKQKTDTYNNPAYDDNDSDYHHTPVQSTRPLNPRKAAPPIAKVRSNQSRVKQEKVSDFQKWQQEQDLQRQERLNKYAQEHPQKDRYAVDYDKELEDEMQSARARRKKEYDEMMEKERELEAMIAKHKADLASLSDHNSSDEETVIPQKAKSKPKPVAKKTSRLATKPAQSDTSYSPYHYPAQDDYESRDNQFTPKAKQPQPKKASKFTTKPAPSDTSYSPYNHSARDDYESRDSEFTSKAKQPHQPKRKFKTKDVDALPPYEPQSPIAIDTSFYDQVAEQAEDEDAPTSLRECAICGRKFAADRIAKHTNICKNASRKKRKVFNTTQQRTAGTELEQYVKKDRHLKTKTPAKSSNWRSKHEEFLRTVRDARQTQAYVAKGGNLADLPPPPPAENPDYKKCPYCERRFNPSTAERHIPRCKDIKSRPKPPRKK